MGFEKYLKINLRKINKSTKGKPIKYVKAKTLEVTKS